MSVMMKILPGIIGGTICSLCLALGLWVGGHFAEPASFYIGGSDDSRFDADVAWIQNYKGAKPLMRIGIQCPNGWSATSKCETDTHDPPQHEYYAEQYRRIEDKLLHVAIGWDGRETRLYLDGKEYVEKKP